jgi:hypothetical protein
MEISQMPKRLVFVCSSILVVALAAACGGGNDTATLPPAPGGAPGGAATFDMSKATATVSGKIAFEGTPPTPQRIQMTADPYCNMSAPPESRQSEEVKVSDGGLENVIVYVKSAPSGMSFATPTESKVIDQKGCHYVPHVFTMMVNQPLEVRNSDMTLHNIHVWAMTNTPVNIGQAVQGMKNNIKLDKEEMPVPIRCDVHRWMNSFVGVFNHPFHTVSGSGGTYELKLPPGQYEIIAWHEKYGMKTEMVQVADNEKKDLGFSFSAAAAAD